MAGSLLNMNTSTHSDVFLQGWKIEIYFADGVYAIGKWHTEYWQNIEIHERIKIVIKITSLQKSVVFKSIFHLHASLEVISCWYKVDVLMQFRLSISCL